MFALLLAISNSENIKALLLLDECATADISITKSEG